jgi:16S rRNA (cytidine1402-2'-O)-methyltransferase
MAGTLIVAANHIGNPRDLSSRVVEVLRLADLLVFEEHRPARQALKAAGIHREYLTFNEHHSEETLQKVWDSLKGGSTVLYMSDQGAATLADPGGALLALAYRMGSTVRSIPGPCSVSAALQGWPLPLPGYQYIGFLPRKSADRCRAIAEAGQCPHPFVVLDTPYRLRQVLADFAETLGSKRRCLVALDISGPDEEFHFGPLGKVTDILKNDVGKRNFVLVVEGSLSLGRAKK